MLSRIVAGSMNWGQWGAKFTTAEYAQIIKECVDIGVTSFDHADIYGHHTTEEEWGLGYLKSGVPRSDLQIISKCGIMMPSPHRPSIQQKHYNTSIEHIISSVERSLSNLKTDYLDYLLIHRPSPLMSGALIAEAIEKLKSEGKVLHFGVSNFSTSQVDLVARYTPVSVNQIELSPINIDAFHNGVLDQCMTNDIRPMAWSPLGGGKLFDLQKDFDLVTLRGRLQNVAKKLVLPLDYMIYAWLLHHPAHINVVTGSTKITRIATARKAQDISFTDSDWFEVYTAILGQEVA